MGWFYELISILIELEKLALDQSARVYIEIKILFEQLPTVLYQSTYL